MHAHVGTEMFKKKNIRIVGGFVKSLQRSFKTASAVSKTASAVFQKSARSVSKTASAALKTASQFFVSCIAVPVWGAFPALQFLPPCLAQTPELPLSSWSFPGRGSKARELAHQLLSRCASQLISHPGKPCPPTLFENNPPISQPASKSDSQIILIVRVLL